MKRPTIPADVPRHSHRRLAPRAGRKGPPPPEPCCCIEVTRRQKSSARKHIVKLPNFNSIETDPTCKTVGPMSFSTSKHNKQKYELKQQHITPTFTPQQTMDGYIDQSFMRQLNWIISCLGRSHQTLWTKNTPNKQPRQHARQTP